MSATPTLPPASLPAQDRPTADPTRRRRDHGWLFHAVMTPISLLWIAPIVFVIFVSHPQLRRHRRQRARRPAAVVQPGRLQHGAGSTARSAGRCATASIVTVTTVSWLLFAVLAGRVRAEPLLHPVPADHPAR